MGQGKPGRNIFKNLYLDHQAFYMLHINLFLCRHHRQMIQMLCSRNSLKNQRSVQDSTLDLDNLQPVQATRQGLTTMLHFNEESFVNLYNFYVPLKRSIKRLHGPKRSFYTKSLSHLFYITRDDYREP